MQSISIIYICYIYIYYSNWIIRKVKGTNIKNNNNNYNNAMTIIQMGIGWFERWSGKLKIRKLFTTPPSQVFLNALLRFKEHFFSHNKSEQLHSNNDFFYSNRDSNSAISSKSNTIIVVIVSLFTICSTVSCRWLLLFCYYW